MTQPTAAARRIATKIASGAATVRFVLNYENPRHPDPDSVRRRYIDWLAPLIDAEFRDAVEALRAISEFWDEAAADGLSAELSPDALIGGHTGNEVITIHDVAGAALAKIEGK